MVKLSSICEHFRTFSKLPAAARLCGSGPAKWLRSGRTPWLLLCVVLAGCGGATQNRRYQALSSELSRVAPRSTEVADQRPPEKLAELDHLDRQALIRAVLARNPNIEVARHGWRAALARYRQVTALDDPMIEYAIAPLSIGSSDASFGQVISISQRFPWPGKLSLEGQVALAEVEAAREDYEAARLRLALMASMLFDQYYVVDRSLVINEEHRQLIEDIKAAAEAQYEAGRAPQQDPLQAEVELAHVLHRGVVLEAQRGIVIAQINGLLHRRPKDRLPSPPETLDIHVQDTVSSEQLQEEALSRRPELSATRARAQGYQSAIKLAERQYYPDLGVMASYNSMWMQLEHQLMVGLSFNLPVQLGARRAAVEEAEARVQQTQAELAGTADEIRVEVEQARERVVEAQHILRLYRERLLPAARAQVESARFGYETGRNSFQALIDAERSLRTLELNHQIALSDLSQRAAELERAVGRVPGLPRAGQSARRSDR